jgi:hypothetical protein
MTGQVAPRDDHARNDVSGSCGVSLRVSRETAPVKAAIRGLSDFGTNNAHLIEGMK